MERQTEIDIVRERETETVRDSGTNMSILRVGMEREKKKIPGYGHNTRTQSPIAPCKPSSSLRSF